MAVYEAWQREQNPDLQQQMQRREECLLYPFEAADHHTGERVATPGFASKESTGLYLDHQAQNSLHMGHISNRDAKRRGSMRL
ncbi:hypothetical protein KCA24_35260, partial [Escherichia coli]|nr:hypothetical protein [Escherichia coli]